MFEDATLSDVIRQALGFVQRRWRGIALCAALGVALSVAALTQIEPRYRSTMVLMVEQPSRSPLETEQLQAAARDAFVDGQLYIIESTEVLRDAVRRADLTGSAYFQRQEPGWIAARVASLRAMLSPARPEERADDDLQMTPEEAYAVRVLGRSLVVDREGDTDVISLSVTTAGPRLSARAATAVGEAFVANREAAQIGRAARVSGWIDDRALELQRQLSEAEDAVAAFRIENNLISGEPGMTLSEQQLTELNTELIRTRAELAERRAAYSRARALLERGGDLQSLPEVQRSEIVTALRGRLLDLERRDAELGGSTGPRLDAVRDERAAVEAQLRIEVERIIQVLGNEVETLEARENLVAEALVTAGGETGVASRSSVELRELERRAAAYRALYERYLANAGLADETVSFLASGVEVIDAASVPNGPVFPPTKVLLLVGLMLGGGIGVVLGLLREATLPGFMTAGQVQRTLGRPVAAVLPQLDARTDAYTHTGDAPMSPFAEAIRTLRHALTDAAGRGPGAPVLLLTSAAPGEGKSNVVAAMAASALRAGQRVLLIDADLRRAGLTALFDMEGGSGLSDLLRDRAWSFFEDADTDTAGSLDIVPSGRPVDSPSDLLRSGVLQRYLQEARDHYDLVLIDGPPVANMADAPIMARLADATGFVIRWNDTPREVVTEAIARLDPHRPLVLALNDVDFDEVAQYGERYEQYFEEGLRAQRGRHGALA